jgi:apolipoprotein N-acyltransferase
MKKLRSYALALGSGVVMGIIPAPINAWWLAWVALAPLWWLICQTKGQVRPAVILGALWGLGYHGAALSWITGLHPLTWMGLSWLVSLVIATLCWLLITLWGLPILMIWSAVIAWMTPRYPLAVRLLVGGTLWAALEWLWTQSPLWWTTLAYTQSPSNLVILHLGRLGGTSMITAALVVVNGLVAASVSSLTYRWRYLGIAVALTLGLHLMGYSLYRQPLTENPAAVIRVGIIQGNVPTRIKLSAAGIERGVRAYVSGYEQLARQGADAVLMPEGAFPFQWPDGRHQSLLEAVRSHPVTAWVGTFMPQSQDAVITQSLITLTPEGTIAGQYNKVKLVPLGEYVPPAISHLVGRLSPLKSAMMPGAAGQTFTTPWGKAAVGICFDSVFPELFRDQVARGGEFILTASNNDPYSHRMMLQHHAHDVMRAIESDRWAARATNTGYSGIVDPHGHTQWISERLTYATHLHQIYRRQTQTPYVRWGNGLLILLICISTLGLVVSTKSAKM